MKTSNTSVMLCFIFFISTLSISCSTHSSPNQEPIYAVKLQHNTIKFWVKSSGCTKPDDFDLTTEDSGQYYTVGLVRNKKDHCRRMPTMIAISYPLQQGDSKPMYLSNPLKHWPR
ncbi:hypothetical protein A9Q99_27235 [Gammaproteobacteria bacterium 45_16_T64]|nr:hypothetical protein A9Q99_27235 [Gammaproteobacteria bacterium 45_16_T64]